MTCCSRHVSLSITAILVISALPLLSRAEEAPGPSEEDVTPASASAETETPAVEEATPPTAESSAHPFEDPTGDLSGFYRLLAAAEEGRPGAPARISVYSDSINGWDGVTSYLRHHLQERFGDGGRGWIHVAPGWTYQHHRDVRWNRSEGWRTEVVNRGRGPGGRYGFGGVLASDGSRHCRVTFETTEDHPAGGAISRFRLFYQAFPRGGAIGVSVDGGEREIVSARAPQMEDRVHQIDVADGFHSFELSVEERNLRLYGVVMEREGPGVVVDSIALIGARVARLLRFDQSHWQRQIELREPDLLVFWLGANNATSRGWTRDAFIRDYGQAIANARAARRSASCLVVSITDIGQRGTGRTLDRVPRVIEAQREVAREQGCAFFDLFSAMGGRGTMRRWYDMSPRRGQPDFRHLTLPGAERIGQLIHESLIHGYEEYREE